MATDLARDHTRRGAGPARLGPHLQTHRRLRQEMYDDKRKRIVDPEIEALIRAEAEALEQV